MLRHDSAIFGEYTPSLILVKVKWITFIRVFVNKTQYNFHSRTVQHLDIGVFYLPTDAKESCLKKY
jgi:ribosomal protein L25 (general stress protein Ctc)